MRPVNKGTAPNKIYKEYGDAVPDLTERIGTYCSYCGMEISHVPEVEHKKSKTKGGELTAWDNLLLSCKYCNTRKKDEVTPDSAKNYLWPDEHNVALAYYYKSGIPAINEEKLMQIDPTGNVYTKAKKLFDLVKLNHIPQKGEKDRRFGKRMEVYKMAKDSLHDWAKMKNEPEEVASVMKKSTVNLARYSGFFPVWMEVFSEEPEILTALIKAFPGTEAGYYDENGHVKDRLTKTMI